MIEKSDFSLRWTHYGPCEGLLVSSLSRRLQDTYRVYFDEIAQSFRALLLTFVRGTLLKFKFRDLSAPSGED